MHSENIKDIAAALAKAQRSIKPALKDTDNPFFKSRYADLSSVWEACRGPLSENGLAVVQLPTENGNGPVLRTMLLHESGQWIASEISLSLSDKATMQSYGSAVTYARRYGLAAMVGVVADEDDDGNQAAASPAPKRSRVVPSAAPTSATTDETVTSTKRALYGALVRIGAIRAGMPDDEKRVIAHKYAAWALKTDVSSLNDLTLIDLTEATSKIGALTATINTNSE